MKIGNEEFSYEEIELMAIYEDTFSVPTDKRITQWWGDMVMYEFTLGVKENDAMSVLNKALDAADMTREEFQEYRYSYKQTLINKMMDNMPEKYEVITLFDKPVLMSVGRIDAQNVPPDLYAYELRHDEGGDIAAVEKSVRVNFAGTILSKDKIEITSNCRKIDYDDYNFLGIGYSADEYLDNYDELVSEFCEQENDNTMTMK